MAPGTEFARDFCAGIGPLQLSIVLVTFFVCLGLKRPNFFFGRCTFFSKKKKDIFLQNLIVRRTRSGPA